MSRTLLHLMFLCGLSAPAVAADDYLHPAEVRLGQNLDPTDPLAEEGHFPSCFVFDELKTQQKESVTTEFYAERVASYEAFMKATGFSMDSAAKYMGIEGSSSASFDSQVSFSRDSVTFVVSARMVYTPELLDEAASGMSVAGAYEPLLRPSDVPVFEPPERGFWERRSQHEARMAEARLAHAARVEDAGRDAAERLQRFTAACGTHYVSSIQRGAQVSIVYTFTDIDESQRTALEAALSGRVDLEVAEGSLSAAFRRAASQLKSSSQVSVKVHARGVDPGQVSQLIAIDPYDVTSIRQILADAVKDVSQEDAPVFDYQVTAIDRLIPDLPVMDYSAIAIQQDAMVNLFLRQLDVRDEIRRLEKIQRQHRVYALSGDALSTLDAWLAELRSYERDLLQERRECRASDALIEESCVDPRPGFDIARFETPEIVNLVEVAWVRQTAAGLLPVSHSNWHRQRPISFHYRLQTLIDLEPQEIEIKLIGDPGEPVKLTNSGRVWEGTIEATPGQIYTATETAELRAAAINSSAGNCQPGTSCWWGLRNLETAQQEAAEKNERYRALSRISQARLTIRLKDGTSKSIVVDVDSSGT